MSEPASQDVESLRIKNQVDSIFKEAVASGRVPGISGLALNASGQVLFKEGYGKVNIGDKGAANVTISTVTNVFSCSKLITSVAALQLIEQGKLRLEDAVKDYMPEIEKVQVLEGFNDDGSPKLRAPKSQPTILNLLTHTAGFTYDFFDKATVQYQICIGASPGTYASPSVMSQYMTPLMFDAGHAYNYGVNTDWLGMVIEKVTNTRIDRYIQTTIFDPLGLKNTGWGKEIAAGKSFFKAHFKDKDGNLTASDLVLDPDSEIIGGGHWVTTTIEDYTQFLLAILNKGTHPVTKVSLLKPQTVSEYIFRDQLAAQNLHPNPTGADPGVIKSGMPPFSLEGSFLPGVKKGWSLALMTNSDDLPNGRKAGSGAWTGLNNTYYWMDPEKGVLGAVFSNIFPFFDADVLHCFDALERAVYNKPAATTPGEPGSNFEGGKWA